MSRHNRTRSLADIVGIQAWHKQFSRNKRKADLHIDVVFLAGRMGGGTTGDVRFKLSLKSAEVVVVIPPLEPLKVDIASVARDAPQQDVNLTNTVKSSRKSKGKAQAELKVNFTRPRVALEGGGSKETADSQERVTAVTQQLQGMTLVHSQTAEGDHRWTVTPNGSSTLLGRPWDATKRPRLKLVDQRSNRDDPLSPTVRVEVRCRREDLEITDIHLSDESLMDVIKAGGSQRNRQAAAEALIRTRLFEEGLVSGDMRDPYALMVLADIQAESL